MRISFSGIYDVRFPVGTPRETIMDKCKQTDEFIKKNYTSKDGFSPISVQFMDWFDVQKVKAPLAKEGIRVTAIIDNPYILCNIFDSMDKDLGQQYVNKSKTELVLNA